MPTEQIPPRLSLGIAITLVANLFFAIASALVWEFQNKFPTIQIVFIQNVVSLICILPISLRKGIARMKTECLPIHLIRDFFGVASYFLYFMGIRHLNLVDASALYYLAPFFIPAIWRIWMKETVHRNIWWSILIGFIGVCIILNPSGDLFKPGFFYAIGAGVSSAIALCAVRIVNLKREPMSRTLFYYFSIGSLFTLPFALNCWVQPVGLEWFYATAIGISIAVGQMLLTVAYRYGTASYLSPLGYMALIYSAFLSWLIYDFPPSLRSSLGGLLIIIGGTLTFILRKKHKPMKEVLMAPKKTDLPPI